MKTIAAVAIGLVLAGSASAAQFLSSPTESPFPPPQYQYQQQRGQFPNIMPQYQDDPPRGMYCQQMQGGMSYCYPMR